MRRNQLRTYQVEGRGAFPDDMLRYDNAVFTLEADKDRAELKRERRIVTLRGPEPTPARWESFGWRVRP
jgi:transposase-like protein